MKRGVGVLCAVFISVLMSTPATGIGTDGYDIIILLRRGDANNDGVVNISDIFFINNYLFQDGYAPACMDAADANDDGWVDLSDSSYLASWLYQGCPMPPAPGPYACGQDPTADGLTCQGSICR